MEVSGQLHAPAALPPGKQPPVPTGKEAEWAPEPFLTRWWREKFQAPAGNRTQNFDHPARSLVAIPTELSRLVVIKTAYQFIAYFIVLYTFRYNRVRLVGMKLGISYWGKSIGWGCLRTECWGEYLDLRGRKWREAGEDCILKTFIICTLHQILLRWSNKGKLDEWDMKHAW
jgi:hypothetical protein